MRRIVKDGRSVLTKVALKIGDPLPEVDLDLGNFARGENVFKDQIVLVHFWSESCPHCKTNMAVLWEWERNFTGSLVQLWVQGGESPGEASASGYAQWISAGTMPTMWNIRDGNSSIAAMFQTNGIVPHYFLFDSKGKLRSRASGGSGLSLLKMALNRVVSEAKASVSQ